MAENWAESTRTVEFRKNVTHELNETPGILYPLAGSSDNYAGSKAAEIEDRFGDLYMKKKTTRNGDTNNVDISSTRRWVKKPGSSNVAPLLDRDDEKSTSVDIKSPLVTKTAMAAARYHDDAFIVGYYGNAWTGETGDTAVPFNSSNKVAHDFGGVSVGLTLDKLLEIRRKLRKANVDLKAERPIMLLDADAETDLLKIPEYKSFDYNNGKPLPDGAIKPFLGFTFISANLTDPAAYPDSYQLSSVGGLNRLPVFVPSGVHRAIWTEFWGKITERDDKQFSTQIYGEAESAVFRLDEKKCWYVETKPYT